MASHPEAATPTPHPLLVHIPVVALPDVQILGNNRKGFSAGKAIGGAILTGGIGLLAGFIGKKGIYDQFCSDCGTRFKVK